MLVFLVSIEISAQTRQIPYVSIIISVLFEMLNALLTVAICASVVHSAALPGFDFPDYQQGLLNGFDFSFGMLKQDYLTKISKLKREAKECSLTASCSKFTEKIEVSYISNLLILFFRFS